MAADGPEVRVIHAGPIGGPPNGMQTVILTLVDMRLGADVAEALPTWEIGRGLRRRLLPALRTAARLLRRDLRGWVVHIHVSQKGSFARKGLILLAARVRGAKVVATPHGDEFTPFAEAHPGIVRSFFSRCDAATALSEEHVSILRGLCPGLEVELVPNPVARSDSVSPAGEQDPVVLFLGTVCLRKGVDVLVEAWPRVREAVEGARCIVAGPVTDFQVPQLPGIEAIGPVDHSEAPKLISGARVVCLPSRSEVLPMTLLEAMAAARPIVATPVGAVSELTAKGGIEVPVGDPAALAEALLRMLQDADLATGCGAAGRRVCEERFGEERVAERLSSLYRNVLSSG